MLLRLSGIDRLDNKSLANFRARVTALVKRKFGGDDPQLTLEISSVSHRQYTGALVVDHSSVFHRYEATAATPRDVLIELLAQVIEDYRFSITDLIQCPTASS